MSRTIGILGAGAWGTALAQTAAIASPEAPQVLLWSRRSEHAQAINETRENQPYLPDIKLDQAITAIGDLRVLAAADMILLCAPAQHTPALVKEFIGHVSPKTPLIICSKGILNDGAQLLSEALLPLTGPRPLGVLSGPSFADELARGLPTAVTVAFAEPYEVALNEVIDSFACGHFRLYRSRDIIGVQLGGAIKNVIAIACGIVAGRNLGENARAAVITRGLAEIRRLGAAIGADDETFSGLSGLGDLTLTCSAMQSRNFSFGYALGQGQSIHDILKDRKNVTEGVATTTAVMQLAARHGVEMPICHSVELVLSGANQLEPTIRQLLTRPSGKHG